MLLLAGRVADFPCLPGFLLLSGAFVSLLELLLAMGGIGGRPLGQPPFVVARGGVLADPLLRLILLLAFQLRRGLLRLTGILEFAARLGDLGFLFVRLQHGRGALGLLVGMQPLAGLRLGESLLLRRQLGGSALGLLLKA